MFNLWKLPAKGSTINVAFSGGVDSLAAAAFFKSRKHKVNLLHFNHGCEYSDHIEEQCRGLADQLSLDIIVGKLNTTKPPHQSTEDFWRRCRYNFLRGHGNFITCHHLDDAVETWIWSSLHGEGKLIPPENEYLTRPFILTKKKKLEAYVAFNNLTPVPDPYNQKMGLTRNYIRHIMMPQVLVVNPGIQKVILKKYLQLKTNTNI